MNKLSRVLLAASLFAAVANVNTIADTTSASSNGTWFSIGAGLSFSSNFNHNIHTANQSVIDAYGVHSTISGQYNAAAQTIVTSDDSAVVVNDFSTTPRGILFNRDFSEILEGPPDGSMLYGVSVKRFGQRTLPRKKVYAPSSGALGGSLHFDYNYLQDNLYLGFSCNIGLASSSSKKQTLKIDSVERSWGKLRVREIVGVDLETDQNTLQSPPFGFPEAQVMKVEDVNKLDGAMRFYSVDKDGYVSSSKVVYTKDLKAMDGSDTEALVELDRIPGVNYGEVDKMDIKHSTGLKFSFLPKIGYAFGNVIGYVGVGPTFQRETFEAKLYSNVKSGRTTGGFSYDNSQNETKTATSSSPNLGRGLVNLGKESFPDQKIKKSKINTGLHVEMGMESAINNQLSIFGSVGMSFYKTVHWSKGFNHEYKDGFGDVYSLKSSQQLTKNGKKIKNSDKFSTHRNEFTATIGVKYRIALTNSAISA
jgi:hypothetical protein